MCWCKDFLSWDQPFHSHILLWPTKRHQSTFLSLCWGESLAGFSSLNILTEHRNDDFSTYFILPDSFVIRSTFLVLPTCPPALSQNHFFKSYPTLPRWETILILWHADITFYNPLLSEPSWIYLALIVFWHLLGSKKRKRINVCVQSSCKVAQTFCKGAINFTEKELY